MFNLDQFAPASGAPYSQTIHPLHLAVLTCGENLMPLGYWTLVSKQPFRLLLSISKGNFTYSLIRKLDEAALNFVPWSEREWVVRAGYLSGRDVPKAKKLGVRWRPAEQLAHTQLLAAAENAFELKLYKEVEGISNDHGVFVLDVVAVHESLAPENRQPILFLGGQSFATLSEVRWKFKR